MPAGSPPVILAAPLDIPSATGWWQADRGLGLADQAAVSSWTNQVPGSNDALIQGTAAKQPIFTASVSQGGVPAVTFDGDNDRLYSTLMGSSIEGPRGSTFTVQIVACPTGGAGTSRYTWGWSSDWGYAYRDYKHHPRVSAPSGSPTIYGGYIEGYLYSDNTHWFDGTSDTAYRSAGGTHSPSTVDTWYVYTYLMNSDGSMTVYDSANAAGESGSSALGGFRQSNAFTGGSEFDTIVYGARTSGHFCLGHWIQGYTATTGWFGHIYGAVIYPYKISVAQINSLEAYWQKQLGRSSVNAQNLTITTHS